MQNTDQVTHADHVAVIMDGNGRWATARGLERLKGHVKGVDRVRDVVRAAPKFGIDFLTVFAFSTENWKRSEREVTGLMNLFKRYIRGEAATLDEDNVRVRFIGDRGPLDRKLRSLMDELERLTETNTGLKLTIALNYGGRDEITRAVGRIAKAAKMGMIAPEDVSEQMISNFLDTSELPDPDLVIRTSGECRTSNFLPWQACYAEYVFTDTAWPDFTVAEMVKILTQFRARDRRFGAVALK
ncbi:MULTISPECIES: isoprenyl transferase [Rhodobacterales]|uniref:isoprenyl transferase n=1 Tax=Roseobacter sp. N2S TaxID=2663844 RepID=UPI002860C6BC|nr:MULTISPECIES: isoprenyl transferase [Rhodobacterales]MDR6264648.1 undecaprenyl diphosphate synthase [Roseobacter sp. N2S]